MIKHTTSYYNWQDIRTEICKEMGIDEKDFRNYHKIVGGEYKDLWHAWIKYFDEEVRNDTTNYVGFGDDLDSRLEWIKADGEDWLEPFVRAVYAVWAKYSIEYVHYSW